MSTVFVDVGMSLDGFIAGPNRDPKNPLGDGGTEIHEARARNRGSDPVSARDARALRSDEEVAGELTHVAGTVRLSTSRPQILHGAGPRRCREIAASVARSTLTYSFRSSR